MTKPKRDVPLVDIADALTITLGTVDYKRGDNATLDSLINDVVMTTVTVQQHVECERYVTREVNRGVEYMGALLSWVILRSRLIERFAKHAAAYLLTKSN